MGANNILIIAIVCAAILGFLIGILITSLRSPKEETPPEEDRLRMLDHEKEADSRLEVLRLERDNPRANLKVRFEGQVYQKSAELNSGQRILLENTLLEMYSWLGSSPVTTPYPAEPAASAGFDSYNYPGQAAFREPALVEASAVLEEPAARKTIVEQIDEILQDKIAYSANPWQHIHLLEKANNEVIIQVETQQYADVEDIPDEPVREMIRAAVADWERKAMR